MENVMAMGGISTLMEDYTWATMCQTSEKATELSPYQMEKNTKVNGSQENEMG
jgi:hypothetical protein